MNTLRRIEADWRKQSKTEWIDQGSRIAHGICAKELSSAIPAWERLLNVAQSILDTDMLVDCDSEHCNFAECAVIRELREALEGVKAK